MPPEDESQPLEVGDIVEIVDHEDGNMVGRLGRVITVAPLEIAVLSCLTLEVHQARRKFDKTDWDEVCREARALGIKIKGTKEKLATEVAKQLMYEGSLEMPDEGMNVSFDVTTPKFRKHQFVKVDRDAEKPQYVGARGTVIDPGPPMVDVKLLASAKVGTKTVRREYHQDDLSDDS